MNKKNTKILILVLSLIILIILSFAFELPPPVKEGGGGGLYLEKGPKALSGELTQENIKASLVIKDKRYEGEFREESTVLEVMKEIQEENNKDNPFNFKYTEHSGLGIFINEINGLEGGGGGYWIYYINGKRASVGVSNYKIKDGDVISWKYEK